MTDTLVRPEPTGVSTSRVRRGGRWRSVLLLVLFVVAGFAVTGVLPVREYLDRGQDVESAQLELDRLNAGNAVLAADISALYTDQEIERVAREQYGFVREGEIGYIITTPEGFEPVIEAQPQSQPQSVAVTEKRSFFERIWDFVTGRDQTTDG
ncbi:MAG: septum formation initiator family protein [Acidobacteria bacterium]|nr:MAG: septum formation initiator family protein [Acidobacteriota bacterium]